MKKIRMFREGMTSFSVDFSRRTRASSRRSLIFVMAPLRTCLIAFSLILTLLPAAKTSAQPVPAPVGNKSPMTSAEPRPRSLGAAGCQWTYYPISGGQLQPEQPLFNDPDNTPLINLSLGNMFKGKSTHLNSTGSTDFDGDNKTDVFRTLPRSDGNLQWQYSSGGAGPWQDLAYASNTLPASALQFGDFNGDSKTDVFASYYDTAPTYHWLYSPSGTDSFVTLNTSTILRGSPGTRRFQRRRQNGRFHRHATEQCLPMGLLPRRERRYGATGLCSDRSVVAALWRFRRRRQDRRFRGYPAGRRFNPMAVFQRGGNQLHQL